MYCSCARVCVYVSASELMNTMSRLAGFNIVGTKTSALDCTRASNTIGHCHCVNFSRQLLTPLIVACKRSYLSIRRDIGIIYLHIMNAPKIINDSLTNYTRVKHRRI